MTKKSTKATDAQKRGLDPTAIIVAVISATAAVVAAFIGAHLLLPPQPPNFLGRVVDNDSGVPIAGAKVFLAIQGAPSIVYTDLAGTFRFEINAPSTNSNGVITVEASGYDPYVLPITLAPGAVIPDIRLSRAAPNQTPSPSAFQLGASGPITTSTIASPIKDSSLSPLLTPSDEIRKSALEAEQRLHHISINPNAALFLTAQIYNYGFPLSDEFEFKVGGDDYVGQVFTSTIEYVKKGDWSNVRTVETSTGASVTLEPAALQAVVSARQQNIMQWTRDSILVK
jgi:hypothetical protein